MQDLERSVRVRELVTAELQATFDAGEDHATEQAAVDRNAERHLHLRQHRSVLGEHEVHARTQTFVRERAEDAAVEHVFDLLDVRIGIPVDVDEAEPETAADLEAGYELERLDAHREAVEVDDREVAVGELAEIDFEVRRRSRSIGHVSLAATPPETSSTKSEKSSSVSPSPGRFVEVDVRELDRGLVEREREEVGQAEVLARAADRC